jgi:peptide/nickel transport system substrate-binding protein
MRRHIAGALLISALALAAPVRAQVLEVGVDQSPAGLDPHLATAFSSFLIFNGTIYEGLTSVDKDLKVGPGLAESWTVSADAKTFTFKLRGGVTFHDGQPMTADDVAASIRRVQSKAIASPLASRVAAVTKIETPNASTLVLTLSESSAPLLTSLATIAIVPKRFEENKDALQKEPMGTGPFKFAEWRPNSFIRVDRHAGYWDKGLPKLAGVKFNIVPEAATRQVGIQSGQYAMLPSIAPATALQLKGTPNVKLAETLDLAYSLVGINTTRKPFDNPKVREALNYALNRGEIVQAALLGAGVPGGPLSPALKNWALDVADFPCYKPDPAKAQALLKEAGLTLPVEAKLMVLPRQDIKDIAQVVQAQLNKAGFKVELVNLELGQFIQNWRNSNFDLFASINAGSPDPDDYFFRTFRTGGSTNVFKYSNAELDKLLDGGRAQTDAAARKATYAQAQKILACEGPIAHLTYGQLFTAVRANISGFEIIANRSLVTLRQTAVGN